MHSYGKSSCDFSRIGGHIVFNPIAKTIHAHGNVFQDKDPIALRAVAVGAFGKVACGVSIAKKR
jgi:hypothetical protein